MLISEEEQQDMMRKEFRLFLKKALPIMKKYHASRGGTEAMSKNETKIRKFLRKGDTITHTRCCGCLEEHIFTRYGKFWLFGNPTKDTVRLGGSRYEADDISFDNITHINRVPIDVLEYAVEFAERAKEEPKP